MRRTALLLALIAAPITALADAPAAKDPKIERTWKAKCASCHGDDGKGQTDQGKKQQVQDVTTGAWQKEFTDAKIKAAIENGIKEERGGVKKEMEPYKSKLRPDQIDGLVAYMRSLAK
jgi:mono/diheme cytochrome c family protein